MKKKSHNWSQPQILASWPDTPSLLPEMSRSFHQKLLRFWIVFGQPLSPQEFAVMKTQCL